MKAYTSQSIKNYLTALSQKEPVPGGGSAAALTAASAASLLSMVARYSVGKSSRASVNKRIDSVLKRSEVLRKRLTILVDEDAKAYMEVVKARKSSAVVRKKAERAARQIPREICRLSSQGATLAAILAKDGNKNLLSDVGIAAELFFAAHHASIYLTE